MTTDDEADIRARVSAKLADYASTLAKHSTLFTIASRDVRSLRGTELSARILELATKVGVTTEALHDFRRYLTDLLRKKTLPP
jgi:poly(A) polymerase Pap1